MEDKRMKNRLNSFMKILPENPIQNREKFMVSLRRKTKQRIFKTHRVNKSISSDCSLSANQLELDIALLGIENTSILNSSFDLPTVNRIISIFSNYAQAIYEDFHNGQENSNSNLQKYPEQKSSLNSIHAWVRLLSSKPAYSSLTYSFVKCHYFRPKSIKFQRTLVASLHSRCIHSTWTSPDDLFTFSWPAASSFASFSNFDFSASSWVKRRPTWNIPFYAQWYQAYCFLMWLAWWGKVSVEI